MNFAPKGSLKGYASDKENPLVKKTDRFLVAPAMLKEEPGFNLRDYDDPDTQAHIEKFARSYQNGEYVPPLLVRVADNGDVLIVEGHCRRRGVLLAIERGAAIDYLECDQFKGNDIERTTVMIRSAEGMSLKPLQIAMGVLRLHRMKQSNKDIALKLDRTPANVEQLLLLATANHDVQQLVREGKVEAYTAIDAIREHGEKAGEFLTGVYEKVVATGGKKVTKVAINGRALPRKVVSGLVAATTSFTEKLDNTARRTLAEIEKLEPEQIKGRKVEIEAEALLELLRAHGAVAEAQKKREAAQRAADAAASQQQLDVDSSDAATA